MKTFSAYALISLACLLYLPSICIAQCTDADSDGYYYEEGCGTLRDCNDAAPNINPGITETCNGFDDDCDGSLDEDCDRDCFYPKKVGSDTRETSDPDLSEYPSLVWTGNEYGLAWADERDNPKANKEIYFARLDNSGNKIGADLRVSNDSDISEHPSLVWTGTEFGVAWTDLRDGNEEIYFARLDSSGSLIGSDTRLTNDSSISEFPSFVWSGNDYGIVWSDFRDGNTEIYFARLDSSGSRIGSDVRITYDTASSYHPTLTWSGSEYGVSWRDYRDGNYEIYFVLLDASGSKIGSDVRITEDLLISDYPYLVWTGNEYGISWEDNRDGSYEIYFARIDPLGNKVGSSIRVTNDSSISDYPSLAWNGTEYGVFWEDYRNSNYEIYFARLDSLGNKIGSDLRVTQNSFDSYNPTPVWNGVEYGVSWDDARDGNDEIYFVRIECCDPATDADSDTYSECEDCNDDDDTVFVGAPEICDLKDNDCDGTIDEGLSIDADEDGHYTLDSCWAPNDDCDDSDPHAYPGAGEILCNGIDENCDGTANEAPDEDSDGYDACGSGHALNPDGLERDCNDGDGSINPGAIETCDGYDNNCDASLDEDCDTICDHPNKWDTGVNVSNNPSFLFAPSLIWTGSEYGIAWEDDRNLIYEIYFARLDSSGNKIGSETRITNALSSSQEPSLVWSGVEYGIAWRDTRDGNEEIYFARTDPSGNKIGSDTRITFDDSGSYEPSLIWTGDQYGIAWHDYRNGNSEVYFARVDPSGNKLGSDVRVTSFTPGSTGPSLAWTGSEYALAWHDNRDGDSEIYFARLDTSGEKIGSDIRITHGSSWSEYGSLIWIGDMFGISWHDYRDGNYEIYFARLDSSGSKIGPDLRVTQDLNDSFYPSLKWSGSEFGVTWNDSRDGNEEIYFARIDSSGDKIGSDHRITDNDSSSQYPSLVWAGSVYGMSWNESSFGSGDIYFVRIRCCDDALDGDLDTYSECNDCDDSDDEVYPGADELCDFKDNDCDGTIDEGFAIPWEVTSLIFQTDKETMEWEITVNSDRWDAVKGDLIVLRSSNGDFASSLSYCLEDDSFDRQAIDTAEPSLPNEGFYYLVRGQDICIHGTYNTNQSGQVGDRDPEIEGSANDCP